MESIQQASTTEIKVANLTFMVSRLASDIPVTQQFRELPVNAFQAIGRVKESNQDYKGVVQWDVIEDLSSIGLPKFRKLMLVDNGDGMSPENMVDYINKMFSSSNKQSNQDNFGIGGKVSTINYNKLGVVFVSWKDGVGSLAWFWFDEKTGKIGLRNWEGPEGNMYDWCPISPDFPKPKIIKDHGTCVILLGNHLEDDTFTKPQEIESGGQTKWLVKYSTSKFFEIPNYIDFKIYDGSSDRNKSKVYRTFVGQREFLNQHSQKKGKLKLSNAVAHWWLMPESKDNKKIEKNTDRFVFGHVACLYENELYGVPQNTKNRPSNKLAQFGVITQGKRVIIYIEPNKNHVYPNTSRTELLLNSDGKSLPWGLWSKEFADNLPKAIQEAEQEYIDSLNNTNDLADLKKSLKKVEELFTFTRWKASKNGELNVIPAEVQPLVVDTLNQANAESGNFNDFSNSTFSPTGNNFDSGNEKNNNNELDHTSKEMKTSDENNGDAPSNNTDSIDGANSKILDDSFFSHEDKTLKTFNGWESIKESKDSIVAKPLKPRKEVFPDVIWTDENDELVDRPFRFVSNTNTIQFNREFRVYKDTIGHYFKEYSHLPNQENVKKIIVQVVQNSFSLLATQSIVFMKNVSKSRQWHLSEVEDVLENPVATAGYIGGLSFIREQVSKVLRNKLKGLR